jgi:hypothetical protein
MSCIEGNAFSDVEAFPLKRFATTAVTRFP